MFGNAYMYPTNNQGLPFAKSPKAPKTNKLRRPVDSMKYKAGRVKTMLTALANLRNEKTHKKLVFPKIGVVYGHIIFSTLGLIFSTLPYFFNPLPHFFNPPPHFLHPRSSTLFFQPSVLYLIFSIRQMLAKYRPNPVSHPPFSSKSERYVFFRQTSSLPPHSMTGQDGWLASAHPDRITETGLVNINLFCYKLVMCIYF